VSFVGDDKSQASIPIIKDAIAEYLMSDSMTSFLREHTGIRHDYMSIRIRFIHEQITGVVWIRSFREAAARSIARFFRAEEKRDIWIRMSREDRHREIVVFEKDVRSDSASWSINHTMEVLRNFVQGYSNENIRMGLSQSLTTDGLTLTLGRWFTYSELSAEEIEYEYVNWVMGAQSEMKSNMPDFVREPLNYYLEGLYWLYIDEGYTITVNFEMRDRPWSITSSESEIIERETMIFERTITGTWEKIISRWN